MIHELSEKDLHRKRVEILRSVPGIGTVTAMELLLELQDVARFRQADQLAAYVGLTPSQYSSAEKIRMGRITKAGKHSLRALLVQAAWQLIRKDQAMKEKYERIKIRSGGKRAIVAIARTLLLRVRRIWLDAESGAAAGPSDGLRLDPFSAPFATGSPDRNVSKTMFMNSTTHPVDFAHRRCLELLTEAIPVTSRTRVLPGTTISALMKIRHDPSI